MPIAHWNNGPLSCYFSIACDACFHLRLTLKLDRESAEVGSLHTLCVAIVRGGQGTFPFGCFLDAVEGPAQCLKFVGSTEEAGLWNAKLVWSLDETLLSDKECGAYLQHLAKTIT